MGAGVMAGFGLWGSMFPIDTIKSKIQADSLSKPQFKGTIDCLNRSLEVEVSRRCLLASCVVPVLLARTWKLEPSQCSSSCIMQNLQECSVAHKLYQPHHHVSCGSAHLLDL
jgi:hypothetical protein